MEKTLRKELEHIARVISNSIDAFTTALFVVDRQKKVLRLAAYCSLSRNIIPDSTIGFDQGLIGWIAKNKKAVNISKFHADATTLRYYSKNEDIKSLIAFPVGGIGVLSVDSKKRYDFTEKDQKILGDFVELVFNVLSRSRRLKEEEEQSGRLGFFHGLLEALLKEDESRTPISRLIEEGARQLESKLSAFALEDAGKTHYEVVDAMGFKLKSLPGRSFPLHSGLAGWVFKNGLPLILPLIRPNTARSYLFSKDEELGNLNSLLAIPLKNGKNVFGVLLFCGASVSKLREVIPRELEILGKITYLYLDQQRMTMQLKLKEYTDIETGFINLTGLMRTLHNYCSEEAGLASAITLFRLNIVDFALYGLRYQYQVANKLLLRISSVLKDVFKDEAQIAHLGGGAFAIIYPGRNPAEIKKLRKQLLSELSANFIQLVDYDLRVHYDIGCAMFPSEARTAPELWNKAEASFERV